MVAEDEHQVPALKADEGQQQRRQHGKGGLVERARCRPNRVLSCPYIPDVLCCHPACRCPDAASDRTRLIWSACDLHDASSSPRHQHAWQPDMEAEATCAIMSHTGVLQAGCCERAQRPLVGI